MAAEDCVLEALSHEPAVTTIRTNIHEFSLWGDSSMHMNVVVDCQASNLKLTHFIIESLGMTRVEHTVVEPDMGHFVEERVRQKGRVFPEVGEIEPDLMFKQVGEA